MVGWPAVGPVGAWQGGSLVSGRGELDAVLLDFDGVVVDTMPLHRRAWHQFVKAAGREASPEAVAAQDGKRAVDVVQALLGPMDEATAESLAAQRELFYRALLAKQPASAIPGVAAFLERLRLLGRPTALVTSGEPSNVDSLWKSLGLAHRFDAVITAADVAQGKPHPEPYLRGAAALGVPIERCLVVEDALPGVASGVSAGAPVLALAPSAQASLFWEEGARWVAPGFDDLPSLLWLALAPA